MAYHYSLDDVSEFTSELIDGAMVDKLESTRLLIALAIVERLEGIEKALDLIANVIATE